MKSSARWLAGSLFVGCLVFCCLFFGCLSLRFANGEDAQPSPQPATAPAIRNAEQRARTLQALEEFNSLVGGWRGVGMPMRQSAKGSWRETGEWVWQIKKDDVALKFQVTDGKLLSSARLTYDPDKKQFALLARLPDHSERRYTGGLVDRKLILESLPDADGVAHQISLTRLNEKRTIVLFQTRRTAQGPFNRVAEVGYTREGTKLAEEGTSGPECIVTGGKGTMSVVYKGQTYYFCCTGCRDAFNDDPEGIIAEAAKRAAKKKSGG